MKRKVLQILRVAVAAATTVAAIATGGCVNKKGSAAQTTLDSGTTQTATATDAAQTTAVETQTAPLYASAAEQLAAEHPERIDSLMRLFVPQFRPGEALVFEQNYTDTLEYVEYDDQSDYYYFVVRKPGDNENKFLYDDTYDFDYDMFNRGDLVRADWHVGVAFAAGDGDRPYLRERTTAMEKLADGPVSLFRAAHPDRLRYVHPDGRDPTDEEAERARERYTNPLNYGAVEYYIAASRKPAVEALARDSAAVICYTARQGETDGRHFTFFDIWNDAETPPGELPTVIARFLLSESDYPPAIYEYSPDGGEITKFSTY